MALKKKTEAEKAAAVAAAAPAFEAMDDVAVMDKDDDDTGTDAGGDTAAETVKPAEKPASKVVVGSEGDAAKETADAAKPVKPAAVTAPASSTVQSEETSSETAVAVVGANAGALVASKKFVGALSHLENEFDPTSLDFNTFPRVTVGLDGFSKDDGTDLGKTIGMEVMSFNDRWVCSPGDDSDEAKKFARYSLDSVKIDAPGTEDDGKLCSDYINELKTIHGYTDAALKKYKSIYGFMTHSNDEEIPEEDREIIGLQVPPQSGALFTRHQITHGVKIKRGIVPDSNFMVCRQEKKQGNGTKKFALINFAAK